MTEQQFLAAYAVACAALLGAVVGSFLNVVAHRVPQGLSVVRPPSACPACSAPIRARHNVPVLGWLVLRGRCADCQAPISARYPFVEAVTAALFAAVAVRTGLSWDLPGLFLLASLAVVLSLIDLDTQRLPDPITLSSLAVAPALCAAAVALGPREIGDLSRALIGALALGALYGLTWLATAGRGMGLGDVKLAPTLGLILAFHGWDALAVGALSAFVYGSVAGIALMAAGRAGRRSRVPFGPFMLGGALTGVFAGPAVAGAYLRLVGLG